MNILYRDYETRSACDLKKYGIDIYARHPSTEVVCMSWALNDNEPTTSNPENITNTLNFTDHYDLYVAHNDAFESAVEEHVFPRQFGFIPEWPLSKHRCTMAMAYAMALPGGLGEAAAAVGLSARKDAVGHRIMMKLSRPRTETPLTFWECKDCPEQFEQLYHYCEQDVVVERELYKRLGKLSEQEQEIWELDRKINNRGVRIDTIAAKIAIELITLEKKRLDKAMYNLTLGAVEGCTKNAQLTKWLNIEGVDTKSVAKDAILDLLDAELPEITRQALLLRQEAAKSSTAKLIKMMDGLGTDERVRGLFQYHGAATGRWAGRRVQLQNLPRPKNGSEVINSVFNILRKR